MTTNVMASRRTRGRLGRQSLPSPMGRNGRKEVEADLKPQTEYLGNPMPKILVETERH